MVGGKQHDADIVTVKHERIREGAVPALFLPQV